MRLIDADKVIADNAEIIDCEIDHPKYQDTLREIIDSAETVDAVEVVWCKDCKWRFDLHCPMFDGETDHVPDLNWFCADGEPRRDIR